MTPIICPKYFEAKNEIQPIKNKKPTEKKSVILSVFTNIFKVISMLELLKVFLIKDERILSGFEDACCLNQTATIIKTLLTINLLTSIVSNIKYLKPFIVMQMSWENGHLKP